MEEIKAGDIMIGNYIRDVWIPNGFFKVTQLKKYSAEYGKDFTALYENLRPIPLTEDILLKAGFEIGGYNFIEVKHPKCPRLLFVLDDTLNSIGWNYNTEGTVEECEPSQIEIKYLHELQNLFKILTGNDLKIEV